MADGRATAATSGAAISPAELMQWCRAGGLDPVAALNHATWCAIHKWYKGRSRKVKSTLTALVSSCTGILQGCPPPIISVEEYGRAYTALAEWVAAGRPFLYPACGATREIIAGFQSAPDRSAARAHMH